MKSKKDSNDALQDVEIRRLQERIAMCEERISAKEDALREIHGEVRTLREEIDKLTAGK